MRKLLFLSCVVFLFAGCLQSKEHLTINKDGSGTFETNLTVPAAIIELIDSTLGAMVKNMQAALGGKAEKSPDSIAEEMFGDKNELVKKAKNAGVNIEFISFVKERKDDGLHVDYKFKFDDIARLIGSDIMGTKLRLSKNSGGDIVFLMKGDPQKKEDSEMQKKRFREWQESEDAGKIAPEIKKQLSEAFRNFRYEFLITGPNEIKEASGVFTKKDSKTASMVFSGDILEDPSLVDKLYSLSEEQSGIVIDGTGVTFKDETKTPQP